MSKNIGASGVEHIEESVKAKLEKSPEEAKGFLPRIRAIIRGVSEKLTKMKLPAGVDLEHYQLIMAMFDEYENFAHDKTIHKGHESQWIRAVKIDEDAFEEQWTNKSVATQTMNQMKVLEFLLHRYLPKIMKNEERAREVRIFFMQELDLLPAIG